MTKKTTKIISIILMIIPAFILVMSAFMKLSLNPQLVEGMTKGGLGNYITLIGVIELVSVILFLIPKTHKLGFLLICGYLGGAMSIELASGKFPMAAIFLAIAWVSVFLRNREMFLNTVQKTEN